jgi:hypothetical protein
MNEDSRVQRADEVRMEYVSRLSERGTRLSRPCRSRVVFRTEQGKIVGIPGAAETPRPPEGGWWLGLPNQRFDFIILLCQTGTGTPLDFVLPPAFVSEVWASLYWEYQSSGWRVQFDVRRHGVDEFELKRKGGTAKTIRRFLGQVEILAG